MTDNFENVNIPETPAVPEAPAVPEVPVMPEIPAPQAPYTDPFQGQQPPQAPVPPTQPEYGQPAYQQPYQGQYQQPQYQAQPGQYPQYPQQPMQPQQVRYEEPPQGYQQKSRLAAALLALTLGVFGVHQYYLGNKTRFIIMLVIALVGSFLCGIGPLVTEIWGLIDGIQLLLAANPDKLYDANGVKMRD